MLRYSGDCDNVMIDDVALGRIVLSMIVELKILLRCGIRVIFLADLRLDAQYGLIHVLFIYFCKLIDVIL